VRAWVLLLVAGAGCARTPPGEAGDAGVGVGANANANANAGVGVGVGVNAGVGGEAARVRVIDPGKEPREKLRYAWRVGQRERLVMELRTAAATESGGTTTPEIALPPVRIGVAIDPASVSPEGDLTYAWRVLSTQVTADTGDAGLPSPMADGMRDEVAAVEHLAGTATVNALGLTTSLAVNAASMPEAGAGGSGQMIEQVRQTLRDLAPPFPDEPVGRGARWEKLSQLSSRDARLTQTDTFTLLELGKTGGKIDDVLAQTAPSQPLPTPGMPNAQARMDSMLASGDGKTAFDRSRLVPQTHFEGTTTMVVSSNTPGDGPQRRTMILRVGITLTGSIAGAGDGGP
jgi:hypothetical protein